ncbi:MAG: serine hydrolase [Anaerolineales bacterium]|nr:serine hydrolase [Anaerolineales bacterium]
MPPIKDFASKLDEMLASLYPADKPGAAVIVAWGGKVLFRKGYGMANLELGVSIEPEMVFRLGSITKQFTAVSILMLQQQGKLDLQDDLTRFLPDYPTGGRRISVEHLLTHTSGIKSYTDMAEWLPLWRKDMSLDELIALFKDQPFDFEPGEQFCYSNSGYILLGAIIEKVSGMSYADFVQKHIFDALGMAHSSYDQTERILPGRVAGYTRGVDGYLNAPYLSMSQPYAAGALVSNVDDMARWDAALYTEELLQTDLLAKAWIPFQLHNGDPTGYGYGWATGEYEGLTFIEHGGGINGFATGGVRVPAEKVYVAVLANLDVSDPSPDMLAFKIAAMAVGHPVREPVAIQVPAEVLAGYAGVYRINAGEDRSVTFQDGRLFSQRTGGRKIEFIPVGPDEFMVKDLLDRFLFVRDPQGKVTGMTVLRRMGLPERATLTDKPLPAQRQAIALEPALLERFPGSYELAPGFALAITLEDGQLYAQAPGQEKLKLFPETPGRLFANEADLHFDFQFDPQGKVAESILTQGPRVMPLKKVG